MLEVPRPLLENARRLDRTMGVTNGHHPTIWHFRSMVLQRSAVALVCEDVACLSVSAQRDERRTSTGPGRSWPNVRSRGVAMASASAKDGFEADPSELPDDDFRDLMARLRAGDDAAETLVFRRFVDRLIVLASHQFDAWMRDHADVEGVVLSAYKSFFIRNGRGDFDLAGWDDLWALLAYITLRKCGKRQRFARAARRDAARRGVRDQGECRSGVASRSGADAARGGHAQRDRRAVVPGHETGRSADCRADPHGLHGRAGRRSASLLGKDGTPGAAASQASPEAAGRRRDPR